MAMSPEDKRKLKGILAWNRKEFAKGGHPMTRCMHALEREGMTPERAARICARTKDVALGTTKWRNKNGKH